MIACRPHSEAAGTRLCPTTQPPSPDLSLAGGADSASCSSCSSGGPTPARSPRFQQFPASTRPATPTSRSRRPAQPVCQPARRDRPPVTCRRQGLSTAQSSRRAAALTRPLPRRTPLRALSQTCLARPRARQTPRAIPVAPTAGAPCVSAASTARFVRGQRQSRQKATHSRVWPCISPPRDSARTNTAHPGTDGRPPATLTFSCSPLCTTRQ